MTGLSNQALSLAAARFLTSLLEDLPIGMFVKAGVSVITLLRNSSGQLSAVRVMTTVRSSQLTEP
jgi:hypothetical protein